MVIPTPHRDIKIIRDSGFYGRHMIKVGKETPPLAFVAAIIQSIDEIRRSGCSIRMEAKKDCIRNLLPRQIRTFILHLQAIAVCSVEPGNADRMATGL